MYLEGKSYVNSIDNYKSEQITMTCGLHQGSILGLLLFNLYMLPMGQIIHDNSVAYHSCTDVTQIYLAISPSDYGSVSCVSTIGT